jgi:hypothetical protein
MAEQYRSVNGKTVSLIITNQDSRPLTLYLEPWADEYQIPPNVRMRIDFFAPTLQSISIIRIWYEQGSIAVEGWEGSVAYVSRNGEPLS